MSTSRQIFIAVVELIAVGLVTILTDRFLSTKAAVVALILCLVILGWHHRAELTIIEHEVSDWGRANRIPASVAIGLFGFVLFGGFGYWFTRPVQIPTAKAKAEGPKAAAPKPTIPWGDKSPEELRRITLAFVSKLKDMNSEYRKKQRGHFQSRNEEMANATSEEEKREVWDKYLKFDEMDGLGLIKEYVNCCKRDAIDLRNAWLGIRVGIRDDLVSPYYESIGTGQYVGASGAYSPTWVMAIAEDLERVANSN